MDCGGDDCQCGEPVSSLWLVGVWRQRFAVVGDLILIAALIGATVLWRRANAAYEGVPYVWAVLAITVRYANETPITFAAYAVIVIIVAVAILGWFRFVRDGGNRKDPA